MSQEKVTRYKEQKANRRGTLKKEKRMKMIRKCVYGIVGIALAVWVGISAYDEYEDWKPRKSVEVDYQALDEYMDALLAEETDTTE